MFVEKVISPSKVTIALLIMSHKCGTMFSRVLYRIMNFEIIALDKLYMSMKLTAYTNIHTQSYHNMKSYTLTPDIYV